MTQGFDDGASTGLGVFAGELDGGTAILHWGEFDGFQSVAVATITGDDLLVLLVNADRELTPVFEQIDDLVFGA
jgi:hypothetical protein